MVINFRIVLLGQTDRPIDEVKCIMNPEEGVKFELEPEDFVNDSMFKDPELN